MTDQFIKAMREFGASAKRVGEAFSDTHLAQADCNTALAEVQAPWWTRAWRWVVRLVTRQHD